MSDWLVSDDLAPLAQGLLRPLLDAAAQHQMRVPACGVCGVPLDLDQRICHACEGVSVCWLDAGLEGEIHAVTVVHRFERPYIVATTPYPVVDVELPTGHRLVLTTVRPGVGPLRVGLRVTLGFRTVGRWTVPAIGSVHGDDSRSSRSDTLPS